LYPARAELAADYLASARDAETKFLGHRSIHNRTIVRVRLDSQAAKPK
jgi:hypothetical protein